MKRKTVLSAWLVGVFLVCMFMIPTIGSANVREGSINGAVTYEGSYSTDHEVLVSAHPDPGDEPVASVHIQGPGAYSLTGLQDGNYYISAFLDIHDKGGGPPQAGEPMGWYDPNEDGQPDVVTVVGGSVSNVDIVMEDITSHFIQGTGCYLGGVHGDMGRLEVGLHLELNQEPVANQFISMPCDTFIFTNIAPGDFYVSLFYDVNSSGNAPEPGEPFGYYDGNGDDQPDRVSFNEGDSITGIDISLGAVLHVDFSAAGKANGSSWEDAFTDLQAAFSIAEPGEEIWVASGVYTPGTERTDSFILQEGVAVYGGFNGTEIYRHQRNWNANITVLSGEIGNPLLKTDNTYHVVTTASTYDYPVDERTILDGFTITSGYANQESADKDKGGGLLNEYGNPTLVNLNFINNYAVNHGGAILSQYNIDPLSITNCTFSGNNTGSNAGGIANLYGSVKLSNSTLVGNTGGNGGGIVNLSGGSTSPAHTEVDNTILWGNTGPQIGLQGEYATASVSNSIIENGFPEGTNIISDDPLLVDADGTDNHYGTLDDDLHLQMTSPARDAGNDALVPSDIADSNGNGNTSERIPFDFDGNPRFISSVDIGADEYDHPLTITGLNIAVSQLRISGQSISFSARAEGGSHMTYTWSFGDGNIGAGPLPTHIYTSAGIYTVQVQAENSQGSQETSLEIEVAQSITVEPGTSQTTYNGILSIELPVSATDTVTFLYTPQPMPSNSPGSLKFAGIAFQLAAFDPLNNPIIEPEEGYKLTINYDESALPDGIEEIDLELYRFDNSSNKWVALEILNRNTEADQFTVRLDHLSEFALLVEESTMNVFLPLILR